MRQSNRLIFTSPQPNDFERFYAIQSDPQTNLFNPKGPMGMDTARDAFDRLLVRWQQNGFGTWCIYEKENPAYIIGFGGLDYIPYGANIRLNVGYRFDKNFWGKGYATELTNYAIQFGLQELHKPEIFAIVRPNHLISIKVLEKCGMTLIDELNDVPHEANSLIYSIKK